MDSPSYLQQGSFYVRTQPMRDGVAVQRHLSLAGCIHKPIPAPDWCCYGDVWDENAGGGDAENAADEEKLDGACHAQITCGKHHYGKNADPIIIVS